MTGTIELMQPVTVAESSVPETLPKPCGYQMLVALPEKQDKTKGGLYMPEDTRDIDYRRSIVVQVVAQGPLCYRDPERFPTGPWCKVGDWIMIAVHVGSSSFRVKGDNREFRILNDDQPLAVVSGPDVVERV